MPTITVKPHPELCPEGASFSVDSGVSVCDALLRNHVHIEHACEKSCACTTCHVHVREGMNSLEEADELEEDYLDKAWGLDPDSRLPLSWWMHTLTSTHNSCALPTCTRGLWRSKGSMMSQINLPRKFLNPFK